MARVPSSLTIENGSGAFSWSASFCSRWYGKFQVTLTSRMHSRPAFRHLEVTRAFIQSFQASANPVTLSRSTCTEYSKRRMILRDKISRHELSKSRLFDSCRASLIACTVKSIMIFDVSLLFTICNFLENYYYPSSAFDFTFVVAI